MNRNNPNINLKYNYVYKTTNLVNGTIYIGVHRTNKLNDGYLGSGNLIKRAISKYGAENFKKEILKFFSSYKEALLYERELVTREFIDSRDNYNLYEGGYGSCTRSIYTRELISKNKTNKWRDDEIYRLKMIKALRSKDRRKKLSVSIKRWISLNPDLHKERMNKINSNIEKITKTADWHRGKKRSEAAKKNIRDGVSRARELAPEKVSIISGKGKRYIFNAELNIIKRISKDVEIPEGWIKGSGPKKEKSSYKDMNRGSVFAYDPETNKIKRFKNVADVPCNYIKGRPKKQYV